MKLSVREVELLEKMLDDVGTFLDRVDIWVTQQAKETGSRPIWAINSYVREFPVNLAYARKRNGAAMRLLTSGFDETKED